MLGLGSSASLGIGLAVYLDDRFTNPSKRLTGQLQTMGLTVNQFRGHVRTLELFAGGVFLAVEALQSFAKFDKTMSATAIIGGVKKGSDDYKALVDQTNKLSGIYGQLPNEIALTNLELAKAGKTVPEIMKLSEAVTALGAATDTKVGGAGGAAEMLVNTMQAFNAASTEGMRYADIMTSAANRSTIDVKDLAESLKYSSDVAKTLNIPFEEAAIAIATLGNAGLKGSISGVAYANMLRYIATGVTTLGTKKQQKLLASWGLTGNDFRDANGNLKNMGQMLEILRKKTAGMNNPDKLAGLTALFGVRGARGAVPLMEGMTTGADGKPIHTFEEMKALISGDVAKGVAKDTALNRIDNLAGDFSKLAAAWQRLLNSTGGRLQSVVRPILQFFVKAIDWLAATENSPFWSAVTKSGAIWMMVLRPLRSLLAIFGPRILGAGNSFTTAFKTSNTLAGQIALKIKAAGDYLVAQMLKARGIAAMGPGGGTLMSRGAGGRVTGGLGRATWFTKIIGAIFGRAGLRGLSGLIGIFGKVGVWFRALLGNNLMFWLGKTGYALKAFGLFLGRAIGWLFGWEAMIADIAITLITGKGIFEWLWDGLKWFGGILYDIGTWFQTSWMGKLFTPNEKPLDQGYRHVTDAEKAGWGANVRNGNVMKTYDQYSKGQAKPAMVHVTVNPTTGDKRTEYFINGNAQRELSSAGIKH